ncbi:MAG: T9SS type A sorting domain-containing protein [Paludibacter sp.]|jgi:hypothetical protein|nr:T9SS type A sorting domain-containing protein [Paludibacter sp.]
MKKNLLILIAFALSFAAISQNVNYKQSDNKANVFTKHFGEKSVTADKKTMPAFVNPFFAGKDVNNAQSRFNAPADLPIYYYDLDYSTTLSLNTPAITDNDGFTDNVVFPIEENYSLVAPAAGYNFHAEAGHFYQVKVVCYLSEATEVAPGIIVMHENLTHDILIDAISANGNASYSNHFSTTFAFAAQTTENVKIASVVVSMNAVFQVFSQIEITEVSATYIDQPSTTFSTVDITLPFRALLHFSPAYNSFYDYSYIKQFRVTLTQPSTISNQSAADFDESAGAITIFADDQRENYITEIYPGETVTLPEGIYYFVITDNGYYSYTEEYLDLFVDIEIEAASAVVPSISLPALLAAATTIPNLPFVVTSTFDAANTPLVVANDNYNFGYGDKKYYATAYKISLTAGQTIKIHEHSAGDAVLYVYSMSEANIILQAVNDDYDEDEIDNPLWNWGDSYIEFTAATTGNYYIVASNYNEYKRGGAGAFYLQVYTGAEPAVPIIQIVSTTPSVNSISVADNVTLAEIKGALQSLVSLTAVTENAETLTIDNNPFGWVINAERTSAAYTNISANGFAAATNYQAATVNILGANGISSQNVKTLKLYPNPASEYIAIDGLAGGETLTILDLNGKILVRSTANGSEQKLSVKGLTNGVYLFAIQSSGQIEVLKFVKQ